MSAFFSTFEDFSASSSATRSICFLGVALEIVSSSTFDSSGFSNCGSGPSDCLLMLNIDAAPMQMVLPNSFLGSTNLPNPIAGLSHMFVRNSLTIQPHRFNPSSIAVEQPAPESSRESTPCSILRGQTLPPVPAKPATRTPDSALRYCLQNRSPGKGKQS
jgi:hypothetical protein